MLKLVVIYVVLKLVVKYIVVKEANVWVYVMTTQTGQKPQDTQLGVSKNYSFCQKI